MDLQVLFGIKLATLFAVADYQTGDEKHKEHQTGTQQESVPKLIS
jgi:hypothetical protein